MSGPRPSRVDVVLASMRPGDGVTFDALHCAAALRDAGFASDVFCDWSHSAPEAREWARDYHELVSEGHRPDAVIYEYSTFSPITSFLRAQRIPVLLRYQNITPARYFEDFSPALAREVTDAREELASLADVTIASLCPSRYNASELATCGVATGPIVPQFCRLGAPAARQAPVHQVRILFVGRLVPNKCQHELVRVATALCQEFGRAVELLLPGNDTDCPVYASLVKSLAKESPAEVRIPGSFPDGIDVYADADLFVSLSEHEGFGMPLVEAMSRGVPVLACAAAAVPETVANGGLLFEGKQPRDVAALIEWVVREPSRWQRLREAGLARAREFAHDALRERLVAAARTYVSSGGARVQD